MGWNRLAQMLALSIPIRSRQAIGLFRWPVPLVRFVQMEISEFLWAFSSQVSKASLDCGECCITPRAFLYFWVIGHHVDCDVGPLIVFLPQMSLKCTVAVELGPFWGAGVAEAAWGIPGK